MGYVIRREDGKFVTPSGSISSYTANALLDSKLDALRA